MVFLGESKGTLISGQEWKGILQAKEITYTPEQWKSTIFGQDEKSTLTVRQFEVRRNSKILYKDFNFILVRQQSN